jgi:hypothetical protein
MDGSSIIIHLLITTAQAEADMTEQEFITAVHSQFGSCTTINETYTCDELLADYREWRARRGHRSPLKNDNKLSRQAYLTHLLDLERIFWQRREDEVDKESKAFMASVRDNVSELKKLVRA